MPHMWLRLPLVETECYVRNGVPEELYGVKVASYIGMRSAAITSERVLSASKGRD